MSPLSHRIASRIIASRSLEGQGGGANYDVWELVMFALVGAAGGAIGAGFNQVNKMITIGRKKVFGYTGTVSAKKASYKKLIEVLIVSFVMSTLSFVLPLAWKECRAVPATVSNFTQESKLIGSLVRFQCAEGEYNELASLFFTEQDVASGSESSKHKHKHKHKQHLPADNPSATSRRGSLLPSLSVDVQCF